MDVKTSSHNFFVTLASDASLNLFPDNKPSHFINVLPQSLKLPGNYLLGLSSISIPHTFQNVNELNNKFTVCIRSELMQGDEAELTNRDSSSFNQAPERNIIEASGVYELLQKGRYDSPLVSMIMAYYERRLKSVRDGGAPFLALLEKIDILLLNTKRRREPSASLYQRGEQTIDTFPEKLLEREIVLAGLHELLAQNKDNPNKKSKTALRQRVESERKEHRKDNLASLLPDKLNQYERNSEMKLFLLNRFASIRDLWVKIDELLLEIFPQRLLRPLTEQLVQQAPIDSVLLELEAQLSRYADLERKSLQYEYNVSNLKIVGLHLARLNGENERLLTVDVVAALQDPDETKTARVQLLLEHMRLSQARIKSILKEREVHIQEGIPVTNDIPSYEPRRFEDRAIEDMLAVMEKRRHDYLSIQRTLFTQYDDPTLLIRARNQYLLTLKLDDTDIPLVKAMISDCPSPDLRNALLNQLTSIEESRSDIQTIIESYKNQGKIITEDETQLIETCVSQLNELQKNFNNLVESYDSSQAIRASIDAEKNQLVEELDQLRSKNETLTTQVSQFQTLLRDLNEEIQLLQAQLQDSGLKLKNEKERLRGEIETLQAVMEQLTREKSEALTDNQTRIRTEIVLEFKEREVELQRQLEEHRVKALQFEIDKNNHEQNILKVLVLERETLQKQNDAQALLTQSNLALQK